MKQLLKRLAPVAVAVGVGVAALVLAATPASAQRVATSVETASPIVTCASPCVGTTVGTAQALTVARSYCLVGSSALVYSGGANRFGFIPLSALVNENQDENCFNGGTFGQADDDIDLRRCAGTVGCSVVGDAAFGDNLRLYCQQTVSGVVWVALFNTNGPQTGFARASEVGAPALLPC